MGYSEALDSRVGEVVSLWGAARRKMFGGTCYLIHGHMMCGVIENRLILRLGEDQASEALNRPHIQPFDLTGRPMKGWVMVEASGLKGTALKRWLDLALRFVETLPPK